MMTGYFYRVLFAGMPYPNPTPAQQTAHRLHDAIGSWMEEFGVALYLLLILFSASRWMFRFALGKGKRGDA